MSSGIWADMLYLGHIRVVWAYKYAVWKKKKIKWRLRISSAFRGSGFRYAVRVGNTEHVLFIPNKDKLQPWMTTEMSSQPYYKVVLREARNQAGEQMKRALQMDSPVCILQIHTELSLPVTACRILKKCKKQESRHNYFRWSVSVTRGNEIIG